MGESPRDIPTNENIASVSKLEVRDEKGNAVTFGSLFENRKTVVIFIRGWFCNQCTFSAQRVRRSLLLRREYFYRFIIEGVSNLHRR